MKKTFIMAVFGVFLRALSVEAQELVIPPSNRSTANLEKNLLFYATERYAVSQSGPTSLPLASLFDGNYSPCYSGPIPSTGAPYTITIENLPNVHVQAGAWVGWTTRYYNPVKFKIEVYNLYDYQNPNYPQPNTWITVADVDSYGGGSYIAPVNSVSVGKIRFTFYGGSGPGQAIGLSELFFIHPEATTVYDGMMVQYDLHGNVGIGTPNAHGDKLAVNGTVHAKQVNVDMSNWADEVFDKTYKLRLSQTSTNISTNIITCRTSQLKIR